MQLADRGRTCSGHARMRACCTCDDAGQLVAQACVVVRHDRDNILSREVTAARALLVPDPVCG